MTIILDGTNGVTTPAESVTGTGVWSVGGSQIYKDASGNVGIGTSSPNVRLSVVGVSNTTCLTLTSTSPGGSGGQIQMVNIGFGQKFLRVNESGIWQIVNSAYTSVLFGVTDSGVVVAPGIYNITTAAGANVHVAADGTMYRSTSSLKYKTDVKDATHGLAEVMTLRPVTYKGKNDGATVFGGLVAEEVHEAGLTEFVQYAEDGTPDALSYASMVSLAFKAIQEQQALIQSMTARITALEAANV
jgi:hypothetical protein